MCQKKSVRKDGRIDGVTLRDALVGAADRLSADQERMNEINVFPIPDGDTGTNLAVTMGNAKRRLAELGDGCSVDEVMRTAAAAMLRGSRGNSGAILTLFFRGGAKALAGKETAGAKDLLEAVQCGIEMAYQSVQNPREGTILTVAKDCVREGKSYLAGHAACGVAELGAYLTGVSMRSLESARYLLDALREADVVDAGGLGFCMMLETMSQVFSGGADETVEAASRIAENVYVFMKDRLTEGGQIEIVVSYRIVFNLGRDTIFSEAEQEQMRAVLQKLGNNVVVWAGSKYEGRRLKCQVFAESLQEVYDRVKERIAQFGASLVDFAAEAHTGMQKVSFQAPVIADGARTCKEAGRLFEMELTVLKDAAAASVCRGIRGEQPGTDFAVGSPFVSVLRSMDPAIRMAENDDVFRCRLVTDDPGDVLKIPPEAGYYSEIKIRRVI